MSFDTEIEKLLGREGGYVNDPNDRGGETNFGISSKANPDVDVANLTREQAIEIYRKRYWEAANVDSYPEHMQGAIFDAAVNHGVAAAKRLARDAGGDLQKFNAGRLAIYSRLLRDPTQEGFREGWMNRLAEFGVAASGAEEMIPPRAADAWSQGQGRPVDRDTAWTTSAYDVEQAAAALRGRSRSGPRDTLGEAAVDYIAALRASAGQEIQSVYDTYRGQTAAAADRIVRSGDGVDGYTGISEEYYEQVAENQIKQNALQQDSALWDQYRYLWREGSATGALVAFFEEAYVGDKTPDPNLRYIDHMHEWEKGRTSDEIEELRALGRGRFNRDMMEALIKQQDKRREDAKVLRYVSPARAFGLSMAAGTVGDPLGVLAGFGAYKGFAALGMASRTALLQGNTARAFLYGGAEAATGELAITGMIDAFGKQQSAGDYAMAASAGFLLGMPFVAMDMPGANRERAARAFLDDLSNNIRDEQAARLVKYAERARTELGEEASPDQVAARASEMEFEDLRANAERLAAEMPDEDMLAPRAGPEADAPEGTPAAPEAPAAPTAPEVGARDRLNLPGEFTIDEFITRVTSGLSVSDRASKIIDRIVSKTEEDQVFTYAQLRKQFAKDVTALSKELDLTIRMQRTEAADAARGDYYRNPEGFMESRELREGIARAEQSGKASDVLRAVVNDTGSPQHLRDLAARLVQMADETDLQYLPTSELEGDAATWGGAYFRDTHQLSVRIARPDFIVHEALHGLTSNILATPKRLLPDDLRARVQKLDDLAAEVRMHYGMNGADAAFREMLDDPLGPMANTQELVTYAMTDKAFQQYLASIPSPRNAAESAWQWFKDLVADLLKLTPAQRTMLDDVLDASGELVDAANSDLARTRDIVFTEAERAAAMYERANAVAAPASPGEKYAPTAILKNKAEVAAVAKKYGLDVGISDPVERALAAEMYARAERLLEKYPIDEARLKPLLSVVGWEATSTRMLLSKNPLMRATAVMLMENPEGAAGRQVTASIIAATRLRAYRDAAEPEYESMYNLYAAGNGRGEYGAMLDAKMRQDFDKAVSKEMHHRWMQRGPSTDNKAVLRAADALDRGYALMASEMQGVGVLGSARLDVGRSGYFPRILRGDRVAALSGEERRIVTQLLSDEMQITAGFDRDFADKLAVKYLEMGVEKATRGWNVTLDLRSPDTADTLRDALTALKFSPEDIEKHVGRFSRGGARFTKSRIDLDLLATHEMPGGSTFQLADLFQHDMVSMYKNYARRASGEVALSRFGIMGTPGVKILRKAITGSSGEWQGNLNTFNSELESFDQFMAEMLGQPFGSKQSKVAGNMRAATSAAFLGGMGFTQLAESGNGLHIVGVAGVMRQIASMPRLLGEVRRIGKGEKVQNSLLHSLEVYTGDIGADQYRLVGLRDIGDRPEVYGQDQLGAFSLAVRGASHGVRVLSMQRAIEAVQVRGFSEQIVRKAMRFIRDGIEDKALADIGITPQLAAELRREMGNIAEWRGDELVSLDLGKMENRLAHEAFAMSVERGASQIIQRTYPGEVGKWAHSDQLLLLTQFRTHPMIATQKQWRRVAFSQGAATAVGYIVGAASIALPIYLARTALQGIGKDDEWWDQKLSPLELGRAASRYTSALGLTSDIIDIASPILGGAFPELGLEARAGRADVAGSVPALSLLNQVGSIATDWDKDGNWQGAPHAVRSLPGSSIPGVQAGLHWLFSDD